MLQCISENPLDEICVDVAEGGPNEPHLWLLHVGLLCSGGGSARAGGGGREGGSDDVTPQDGRALNQSGTRFTDQDCWEERLAKADQNMITGYLKKGQIVHIG